MKELMIALQPGEDGVGGRRLPLYEQIYGAIRREIEAGGIACGEKLPSTRLLASNLGVSRFTVDLAYGQLVSEGYIQARAGSGFFVCEVSELPMGIHASQPPAEPVEEAAQAYIDFSPFAVDGTHFPLSLWKKRSREALDQTEELLTAGDAAGLLRLRAMLAGYLYRARGVRCVPEQVFIGAGNEYLLLLLAQLLEKPDVAMESPTYVQAYEVLRHARARVYPVPMDAEGLCLPLPDGCPANVVYVMPSHQFPVGTVMPLKRRQALLDWAAQGGRYIIEDDHDSEFRYVGRPIPSLQGRDMNGRVIYLGTFSKSISPALRVSYMVLPLHLLKRFRERLGFYSPTVSTWQQQLLCLFMETGDFERHLNRMRRIYRAKHDMLLRELKKRPWVRMIRGENAGLHLVVTAASTLSEEALAAAALEKNVRLCGLKRYRIPPAAPEEAQGTCGAAEDSPGARERRGASEHLAREKGGMAESDGTSENPGCVSLVLGFGGLSEAEIMEGLAVLDELLGK